MSRRCEEVRSEVYTYLDGEATWWQRARIRWHLRRCPPCDGGFTFERKLQARVREDCLEDVPEELVSRIRAFLSQHEGEAEA